jgi:hypothetical protein
MSLMTKCYRRAAVISAARRTAAMMPCTDVIGYQLADPLADDFRFGRRGPPGVAPRPSNPIAQRDARSSTSSAMATIAPTIAKSP